MAKTNRMTNREVQKKYADTKKRLHTCGPLEYRTEKHLLDYWYNKLLERSIAI